MSTIHLSAATSYCPERSLTYMDLHLSMQKTLLSLETDHTHCHLERVMRMGRGSLDKIAEKGSNKVLIDFLMHLRLYKGANHVLLVFDAAASNLDISFIEVARSPEILEQNQIVA